MNIEFWTAMLWPSSFSYLVPLDCAVLGIIGAKACANPNKNVIEFKAGDDQQWASLSATIIGELSHMYQAPIGTLSAAEC